jgi:hypothetical protein
VTRAVSIALAFALRATHSDAAPAATVPPSGTPELTVAPRPDGAAVRVPGTPTTLYINYDGALLQEGCGNDPTRNCSTLAHLFSGYVGPFYGNELQKMSILQAVRNAVSLYGIDVVATRPEAEVEYSMVLYGDLGDQSFAGIAPYIDCEDVWPRDTSFSAPFTTSNSGATVILQEAAHTWGLEHVDALTDILNPFVASGTKQLFRDECFEIVANTDLEPSPGICNVVHELFCATGEQNSHREMLHLFGPGTPDASPPTLEIVSPEQDATFVAPASVPLVGRVTDDRHPQVYQVHVQAGAVEFDSESGALGELVPLASLNEVPAGDYELVVTIADGGGNEASDVVNFTVLPEGSSLPGDDGAVSDAGFETEGGCRIPGPPRAPAVLAPLLLLFVRRRTR